MKKHSRKEMQNLINHIRAEESKGFVCDAHVKCEGWEKYRERFDIGDLPVISTFKYCPWCGKEIE